MLALAVQHATNLANEIPGLRSQSLGRSHDIPLGATYHPKTGWCDFAVDVRPEVSSVEIVVRRQEADGRYRTSAFPMERFNSHYTNNHGAETNPPSRWVIGVSGLTPGDQYTLTLRDSNGAIVAERVSDPYALASTSLVWKAAFINRVREKLAEMRLPGESDSTLLERFYTRKYGKDDQSPDPSLATTTPTTEDFDPSWSIVIDRSRLLEQHKVQMPNPHKAGEREVVKFHPLMSIGIEDRWISPEFRDKRGTLEVLLCPLFRSYLKQFGDAIEFFPLGPRHSDPALIALGRESVWGYMPSHPLGLGPENFTSRDPHAHLRTMQEITYALKQDGFSVIADIVSGHSAEGPAYLCFSISLRHLAPEHYFLHDKGKDIDKTGCGNTLSPFSALTQALLTAQSKFYTKLLGMERRIDQAATAGIQNSDGSGFNPNADFFKQLMSISENPMAEINHGQGHFNREVPENTPVTSWDFSLRNLQYALSFGESAMWPNSNPKQYRAFIASGSCGGVHKLQNLHPWSSNRGIQVFPHDGETVWDRARWAAVATLCEDLSSDPAVAQLAEKIAASPNTYDALFREGQPRYAAMRSAVTYLREAYPEKFLQAQGAAARWLLAQLYTTPGDVLMVAGDHIGRTQNDNPNAYSEREYLMQALSPNRHLGAAEAEQQAMNRIIDEGKMLLFKLQTLRRRFDSIFHNTSIVDGFRPSSKDKSIVPALSWHNADGEELSGEEWEDASSPFFLGWCYSAYPTHEFDRDLPQSRLFFADTSVAREFRLPDPGPGRVWRELLNSPDPLASDSVSYSHGSFYYMPSCGMAVFESVIDS